MGHLQGRGIARVHPIEACLHFAAFAYVGESVSAPGLYFENNVTQGLSLLESLVSAGVRHMVYSSSCATYGDAFANGTAVLSALADDNMAIGPRVNEEEQPVFVQTDRPGLYELRDDEDQ